MTKKKTNSKEEVLVITSKVKEALKEHDVNVGSDAIEGLNNVVQWFVKQAALRAKENGRKTVRSHDFVVL